MFKDYDEFRISIEKLEEGLHLISKDRILYYIELAKELGHSEGEDYGFIMAMKESDIDEEREAEIYDNAYGIGFDEGRAEGYDEGQRDGYNEGHEDGYNEGYDECKTELGE